MQNGELRLHTAFGSTGDGSAQQNIERKSADLLDTMQVVQTMRRGRRTHALKFVNTNNVSQMAVLL